MKSLAIYSFACSFIMGTLAQYQQVLGSGKWTILNLARCANADEYPWALDVRRRRLNRTHEGISVEMELGADLDDSCDMRIELCICVYGGCKPFTTLDIDCLPQFLNKWAAENVKAALTATGLDPPEFPVKKGKYQMRDFVFDTTELPDDGMYGEFAAEAYIVRDGVDVACMIGNVRYA